MEKTLLTISIKMIAPISDEVDCITLREGEVVYTIPVTMPDSPNRKIEVYRYDDRFEWRIIELATNNLGVYKKIVKFDSWESIYNSPSSALRDALLFCTLYSK